MKKLILVIVYQLSILYCFAQTQSTLIDAIKKHKPDWIDSWESYPFIEVKISPKQIPDWMDLCSDCDTISYYEPFYVYSPNKKMVVDAYSVRFVISYKNGEKAVWGGDPDTGVFLFDLENRKAYRMLYYGTIPDYDDVLWLSNTAFVILTCTFSIPSNGYHKPQLIVIDIKDKTCVYHTYKDNKRKFDYIEKKFLKLGFNVEGL